MWSCRASRSRLRKERYPTPMLVEREGRKILVRCEIEPKPRARPGCPVDNLRALWFMKLGTARTWEPACIQGAQGRIESARAPNVCGPLSADPSKSGQPCGGIPGKKTRC